MPSKPIASQDGYRILKVISREPAGQRELNDPRVQQEIRETLLNRKDQLLKAAYYEVARNGAKIENYLAQGIVEKRGNQVGKAGLTGCGPSRKRKSGAPSIPP